MFKTHSYASNINRTGVRRDRSLWFWLMARVTPLGVHLDSASPAEVKLAEITRQTVRVSGLGPGRPRTRHERLIADKAYDSDPLRERLALRGIELIVPHQRFAFIFLGLIHMACALIALKRVVG